MRAWAFMRLVRHRLPYRIVQRWGWDRGREATSDQRARHRRRARAFAEIDRCSSRPDDGRSTKGIEWVVVDATGGILERL